VIFGEKIESEKQTHTDDNRRPQDITFTFDPGEHQTIL
jgi:hypothetical protein